MLLRSLCCGSKCCSRLADLSWKSSGNCEDITFWCGEEQECPWQTDIEQIFLPNLTEEFSKCTYGIIEKNLVDVGKSRHKKGVRVKIVSPLQGHLGKMWQHLAFGATCCWHVGDFLSQAGHVKKIRYVTWGIVSGWQHPEICLVVVKICYLSLIRHCVVC